MDLNDFIVDTLKSNNLDLVDLGYIGLGNPSSIGHYQSEESSIGISSSGFWFIKFKTMSDISLNDLSKMRGLLPCLKRVFEKSGFG